MKITKLIEHIEGDRIILIETDAEVIVNIDFMQGINKESYKILAKYNRKPNIHLLEIYKRMIDNKPYMKTKLNSEIEEYTHAIDLYIQAFIFSETFERGY